MLYDFNEASDRLNAEKYDICICGTGPAGVTVARRAAAKGARVLLIEGGDLTYTEESQLLYEGKSIGKNYWHVSSGRLRFFGGASNHWSGRCGVFDSIDFEQRPYYEMPGWPIGREEILAHLEDAKDILDIGGMDLS